MESLIGQDNQFHKQAHLNVLTRMEKRAPKTLTEKILVSLIGWQANKSDHPHGAFAVMGLIDKGWIQLKDFGFKRQDLMNFHKYGQISERMGQILEQVPNNIRKVFRQYEDRKYLFERREYDRLRALA